MTGPYNAIHVGAAAPTVPEELVAQLASPGRMFIPVGTHVQYIKHIDKDEQGNVTQKQIMGVSVCLVFFYLYAILATHTSSTSMFRSRTNQRDNCVG